MLQQLIFALSIFQMYKFLVGVLVISFLSCSNKEAEEKTAVTNTAVPEEEKKIRNQVNQYPDSLTLRNKLVDFFAKNGDYESAVKENNLLLQKDINNPQLWDAKARLHFLNRDTANAIKAMEKTVEIAPQPVFLISLATIYAQTKNPKALDLADSILQRSNGKGALQAYFIKGLFFSNTGNTEKALGFFDECIKSDYTYLDAYREKAILLYDSAKYLEALKVLELQLSLSTTNEEAYYWMGRCFEKLGKKEQAVQNYQLALQIDKDYVEAKDALGKLGVVQ